MKTIAEKTKLKQFAFYIVLLSGIAYFMSIVALSWPGLTEKWNLHWTLVATTYLLALTGMRWPIYIAAYFGLEGLYGWHPVLCALYIAPGFLIDLAVSIVSNDKR